MMGEESNTTMPPEQKSGMKRTEKRTTTSTTDEFEKHPYGEGLNGVVGKSTTKAQACCGLMENISRL